MIYIYIYIIYIYHIYISYIYIIYISYIYIIYIYIIYIYHTYIYISYIYIFIIYIYIYHTYIYIIYIYIIHIYHIYIHHIYISFQFDQLHFPLRTPPVCPIVVNAIDRTSRHCAIPLFPARSKCFGFLRQWIFHVLQPFTATFHNDSLQIGLYTVHRTANEKDPDTLLSKVAYSSSEQEFAFQEAMGNDVTSKLKLYNIYTFITYVYIYIYMSDCENPRFTEKTSTNLGRSHRLPHVCTIMIYGKLGGYRLQEAAAFIYIYMWWTMNNMWYLGIANVDIREIWWHNLEKGYR